MRRYTFADAILSVLAVIIVAGTIYAIFFAPCGWFKYAVVKDIPARCTSILETE